MAQLLEYLPSMHEVMSWVLVPAGRRPDAVVCNCDSSTREVGAGESGILGHPWLQG